MNDRDVQLVRRLRDESAAPPDEVRAARERLFAVIQEEIDAKRGVTPRRAPRVSFPRLVTAVGAVAVLLVAVIVAGQVLRPPAAVAGLTELAAVAEARPALTAEAGQGVYVRSVRSELVQFDGQDLPGVDLEVVSFLLPQTREVWVRPDGTRRLRIEIGAPVFFDAAVESAFYTAGFDADYGVGSVDDVEFAAPEVDLDVAALPTEAEALRIVLESEIAAAADDQPVAVRLFELAGALLRETTATPLQRAALLEVIADIDGIELVRDDDGVLAVGVDFAVGDNAFFRSLEFDRSTAALIGEEVVAIDGIQGVPANTPIVTASYTVPEVRGLP